VVINIPLKIKWDPYRKRGLNLHVAVNLIWNRQVETMGYTCRYYSWIFSQKKAPHFPV